jgi:hypothetical protein
VRENIELAPITNRVIPNNNFLVFKLNLRIKEMLLKQKYFDKIIFKYIVKPQIVKLCK